MSHRPASRLRLRLRLRLRSPLRALLLLPLLGWLRLGVLVALAVCVLAGTARAGTAAFFCDSMQEERAEPCCRHAPAEEGGVLSDDCACCHVRLAQALPASTLARSSVGLSLPATLATELRVAAATPRAPSASKSRPGRGEGIPPPHLERRVVLLI